MIRKTTQRVALVLIIFLLVIILLPIFFSDKLSLLATTPSPTHSTPSIDDDGVSKGAGNIKDSDKKAAYKVIKRKELRAWIELISAVFGGFLVIISVIGVVRFQRIRRQHSAPNPKMRYKDAWSDYRVTEEEIANVELPDLDEFNT